MKDQIAKQLQGISNLDDRLLLKNVLNDVFLNLYEHSETMYRQLEERVFSEMAWIPATYDIYTTITSRPRLDPVHTFLRPMQESDLQEQRYDLSTIRDAVANGNQYPLMKVFFSCDYRRLKNIMHGQRSFAGKIITNQGGIDATFTLHQDKEYMQQVTNLYENFLNNNIPWKTVNAPYLFRFAHVILEQCERLPAEGEIVKEIKVNFAEYGPYVSYDMVPLWNVEVLQLKSTGFPTPCQDKINSEHTISLKATGLEHGYLAAFVSEVSTYTRRTVEEFSIIGPQEQNIWDIIRIIHPTEGKNEQNEYPLLSNAKRQGFSDILALRSQRAIRTEAELKRLIGSFLSTEGIALSRLAIVPRGNQEPPESESYEMNFFIQDEVRRDDYQNRLLLYFTVNDKENFLSCDQISFVVSEVQIHYPEYKCEGVML